MSLLQKMCKEVSEIDLNDPHYGEFDGICVFYDEINKTAHILDLETSYELESTGIGFVALIRYREPVLIREIRQQVESIKEE